MPFVEPRPVRDTTDCWFYHVMDLPGIGTVGGQWDLRGRTADYTGHVDMRGKRVLDVGTASGFLTFELEKMGANVVSFDADGPERLYLLPLEGDLFTTDRAAWIAQYTGLAQMQNGYWLAHRTLGSKARAFYGNIYDIPGEIGRFDIGVIGQILVHLSDPIRALASVMRRCDRLVITEGMIDDDKPMATLGGNKATGNIWSWWRCSTGLYREVLSMAGWEIERIERDRYLCPASAQVKPDLKTLSAKLKHGVLRLASPSAASMIRLTTIVAKRS